MYLRKALAGSAPDITWHEDGDVREVPDSLAWELLAIPEGGFTVVEPEQEAEPEPEEAPKRRGRPPMPRNENGEIVRD